MAILGHLMNSYALIKLSSKPPFEGCISTEQFRKSEMIMFLENSNL